MPDTPAPAKASEAIGPTISKATTAITNIATIRAASLPGTALYAIVCPFCIFVVSQSFCATGIPSIKITIFENNDSLTLYLFLINSANCLTVVPAIVQSR